ncbi:MAG TPA: DHH family phosphoesterase [Candidatus Saccharimonadales bacterium]|nr:DHH family phosphoesterase [Candidatus Saccharimonadales bacterium]
MYDQAEQVKTIVESAQKIVIVQADNPDADSVGSALALEHILGDLGKEPYLYCAVETPGYLRYLPGWDRVQNELPHQFDASIIVDASTITLLEKVAGSGQQGWLASKPCVVLDHHESVDKPIPFATVTINDHQRASTGELIYLLAQQLAWPVSIAAQELLMNSILGDTQGLTNQLASAQTYRIMADFVEAGVDRPALEEQRRAFSKMVQEIYRYKAQLIQRTAFSADGRVASVVVPQSEINEYSPLYNPAPLIQGDMLQTTGVAVAIVLKTYDDGHMTGAIRCNPGAPVAAPLAETFGGGGHAYAGGFKIDRAEPFDEQIQKCLARATELLAKLDQDETV